MPRKDITYTPMTDDDVLRLLKTNIERKPELLDRVEARYWLDFIRPIFRAERGYDLTPEQIFNLGRGIPLMREMEAKTGFRFFKAMIRPGVFRLGYQDIATGRLISRLEAGERALGAGFKKLSSSILRIPKIPI